MGKAQDSYDIDDLQSDAGTLGHLIETIADLITHHCEFVAPNNSAPGERLPAMDRLDALVRIACDQIDKLNANIDTHYAEIAGRKERADA